MGFHKVSPTRNMRTPRAHLERKENGDVYAVLKLGFKKDSPKFQYCFIGANVGTLTFKENIIIKHPKFKGIDAFEGWCMKYCAEHEI